MRAPLRSYSAAPTLNISYVKGAWAAFKIEMTASVISGPIPSPLKTVIVFIGYRPSLHI